MDYHKALFIGINYKRNANSHLENCVNDALDMHDLFTTRHKVNEIKILIDNDNSLPDQLPTKKNIIDSFNWLFDGAKEGDHLFVHYSGHGGSVVDKLKKEKDGKNETLCNLDYPQVGEIIDDELNLLLVKPAIEKGVHLFMITDCCHSGSNCDERYSMKEVSKPSYSISKIQPGQIVGAVGQQHPQMMQMYPGSYGQFSFQQPGQMISGQQQFPFQQPGQIISGQQPQFPFQQQPGQMISGQQPQFPFQQPGQMISGQQPQFSFQQPQQPQPLQIMPGQQPQMPLQIMPYEKQNTYVVYNGKLYNSAAFYRKHIEPIEKAHQEISEFNAMKNILKEEHNQMRSLHPRDVEKIKKNKNKEFFKKFLYLKEKVEEYLNHSNPFIKLLFKTGQMYLPSFQECGDMVNSINIADRMRSRQIPHSQMQIIMSNQTQPQMQMRGIIPNPVFQYPQMANIIPTSVPTPIKREMSNSSQIIQNKLTLSPVLTISKKYAERSNEVKWSCEEDKNMPFYNGKGTFIKLSGCMDDQTSADGYVNMENGAMTGCIITFFRSNPNFVSIGDFLFNIRKMLHQNRFEQIPQIGSNNVIDSASILPF